MNCNRRNGTSRKSPCVFPSLLSMKNFLLLLTLSLHCLPRSSVDIECAWTNLQKRVFPQFSEGRTSGDWGAWTKRRRFCLDSRTAHVNRQHTVSMYDDRLHAWLSACQHISRNALRRRS